MISNSTNPPSHYGSAMDAEEGLGDGAQPCQVSSDPRLNEYMAKLYEQSLGEERLDAVEELDRQQERSETVSRYQRWQGQERWQGRDNEAARLVNIRHPHWFMRQLRHAGVDARIEDQFEWHRDQQIPAELWTRPAARLWLNSFSVVGRVGITGWVAGQPKTIATLQYPYGPEYSIMRFNQYNVPTAEKYLGWRTALLKLIYEGVLTEREAERAFGPALGLGGSFYREQLQNYRAIHQYGIRREAEAADI